MEFETLFTTQYYSVGIWIVIGLIIAAYIGLAILWNKKYVPFRRARNQATPKWGVASKRVIDFAFKEDPRNIAPKKVTNKFVKKILSLKLINWVLLLSTFALIGLNKLDLAWIPALILVIVITGQVTAPLKQRDKILQRMYAVAASSFGYGKDGLLNPWAYVQIRKWEGLTQPAETHLTIPANWDASSPIRRDGLESHFNTTVTDNNTWVYEWKTADGVVIARPVSHIPSMVKYEGSAKYPWHVFPLGMGVDGDVTVDLQMAPHFLVTGTTGSGKSVLQRNIVFHCIQHNDMWRFLGVDLKRVELSVFKKYSKTVMGIATTLEDGVEVVRYARDVMMQRYEEMEGIGINHFKDMKDENGRPPYAIMLMIDEAFMFLSPEGVKTDQGKINDQLHGEATIMLGEIARLGRAAGVHLVVATQRPDATVIKGEFKQNLAIRILAGRSDSTASSMTLDSAAGTTLPGIKGRGMVSIYGAAQQFQGYFAPAEWIDEWLAAHPGVEPALYPKNGGPDIMGAEDIESELEELAAQYDFEDGQIELNGEIVSNSGVVENIQQEEINSPALDTVQEEQPIPIEPKKQAVQPAEKNEVEQYLAGLDLFNDDSDEEEIVVTPPPPQTVTPTVPKVPIPENVTSPKQTSTVPAPPQFPVPSFQQPSFPARPQGLPTKLPQRPGRPEGLPTVPKFPQKPTS